MRSIFFTFTHFGVLELSLGLLGHSYTYLSPDSTSRSRMQSLRRAGKPKSCIADTGCRSGTWRWHQTSVPIAGELNIKPQQDPALRSANVSEQRAYQMAIAKQPAYAWRVWGSQPLFQKDSEENYAESCCQGYG